MEPKPQPEPTIPLTQKVKRRRTPRPVKKDDTIKVGSIRIEKRHVTFEF